MMTTIIIRLLFIAWLLNGNPPFCFQWCMAGPENACQRGCEGYDSDRDMDVDLRDWAAYTLEWVPPG